MEDVGNIGVIADWLGCSERTVKEYSAKGLTVKTGRGQYVIKDTVAKVIAYERSMAAGRGGAAALDLTAERARFAASQADVNEHKLAVLRGEYLRAGDVRMRWDTAAGLIRACVLSAVSAIAQALSHLTRHDVDTIDRILRDALTQAADEIDGLGDIGPQGEAAAEDSAQPVD